METENNNTNEKGKRLCLNVSQLSAELGIGLTNAYALVNQSDFYPAKRIGNKRIVKGVQDEVQRSWVLAATSRGTESHKR
jgi:hypothetical protein